MRKVEAHEVRELRGKVDKEKLIPLKNAQKAIAGSGYTWRQLWIDPNTPTRNMLGLYNCYLDSADFGITDNTRVFCSGWEHKNGVPVMGEAVIYVYSIAANKGLLGVKIEIVHTEPIPVGMDYLIINP
jgi:hypothetical protein